MHSLPKMRSTKNWLYVMFPSWSVPFFLSIVIQNIPGKVSFTFDAWTLDPGDPYLSITGHYIDTPTDWPGDWVLKSKQLAFDMIKGCHTGKNIAQILVCTVDCYNLCGKASQFFYLWHLGEQVGKLQCIEWYGLSNVHIVSSDTVQWMLSNILYIAVPMLIAANWVH